MLLMRTLHSGEFRPSQGMPSPSGLNAHGGAAGSHLGMFLSPSASRRNSTLQDLDIHVWTPIAGSAHRIRTKYAANTNRNTNHSGIFAPRNFITINGPLELLTRLPSNVLSSGIASWQTPILLNPGSQYNIRFTQCTLTPAGFRPICVLRLARSGGALPERVGLLCNPKAGYALAPVCVGEPIKRPGSRRRKPIRHLIPG